MFPCVQFAVVSMFTWTNSGSDGGGRVKADRSTTKRNAGEMLGTPIAVATLTIEPPFDGERRVSRIIFEAKPDAENFGMKIFHIPIPSRGWNASAFKLQIKPSGEVHPAFRDRMHVVEPQPPRCAGGPHPQRVSPFCRRMEAAAETATPAASRDRLGCVACVDCQTAGCAGRGAWIVARGSFDNPRRRI